MNVKEVRLTFQVSGTSFFYSNYWLNFLIRDFLMSIIDLIF